MGDEGVTYISGQEAARRLGCSPVTVSRIARQHRIGIIVEDGRLAALATGDLVRLRPLIHASPGNPVWIAAGKAKVPRARKRAKPV